MATPPRFTASQHVAFSPREVFSRASAASALHGETTRSTWKPAPSIGASRGKYVYCIIESSEPLRFGPIGVGADPSDVYTDFFGLQAIADRSTEDIRRDFVPRLAEVVSSDAHSITLKFEVTRDGDTLSGHAMAGAFGKVKVAGTRV